MSFRIGLCLNYAQVLTSSEHADIVFGVEPVTPNFAVYRSAKSNGAVIYEELTFMLVLSSK